ncbi:hypothetical protein [Amycolatopsis benzoatilytica]|uniref:hypothetical protein n=1 Tax=Amycolatopsis benzoatilytica TaxID=346045 RepID=UPI0003657EBA|nr:hypothetical protein [Amycolatopsis benzoatilytica]
MLWLFGQIWLWLLVSFLLGATATWLLMRTARPKRAVQPSAPLAAPVEQPAEETRHIPANPYDSGYEEPYGHYEDEPERVYNDYPEVDPDEPYDARYPDSGARPLPDPEADLRPRLSGELNWPGQDQQSPHWPHSDEPAPRRPGRGG